MAQQVPVPQMVNQSVDVLSHPAVATFERYERRGSLTDAAIYIGIAALIAGLLGVFTLGFSGILVNILNTLATFLIFTGLVYYVGKSQGGTGTFNEVAYTFSLFIAPLSLIMPIAGIFGVLWVLGDLIWLLAALATVVLLGFFGNIAVRSSMNITSPQTSIVTLGSAVIGTFVILGLLHFIF